MKRIPLRSRVLPHYSHGEEVMNMVTHIVGGALAILTLVLCLVRAVQHGGVQNIICATVYGCSMIAVYTMSSIYHGLHPGTGKKVMQIIDHCTIYFLIAGTYTPIVVCALAPDYPAIGWGLFLFQWALAITATVLTAIDLKRYRVFSMVCYIGMGWSVILFLPQTITALSPIGFGFLLAGGIAYTIGAILFGIGRKVKWMHSVFHLFVIAGSMLQMITVAFYVL